MLFFESSIEPFEDSIYALLSTAALLPSDRYQYASAKIKATAIIKPIVFFMKALLLSGRW
jgi:hypothetical protein